MLQYCNNDSYNISRIIATHKNNDHNNNPTEFVTYQSILLHYILRNGEKGAIISFYGI